MATKKKPTQLDRIERSLEGIAEEVKFLKALNVVSDNHASPESLQPGDYTDASKDVADALTAMGWEWWDEHRHYYNSIGFAERKMTNLYKAVVYGTKRIAPAEFLSRAAVTAKEIGLVPVVEKWVPKVGDWVVWNADIPCVTEPPIGPRQVTDVDDMEIRINRTYQMRDGMYRVKDFRPATDAEVQKHLAEHGARANAEKVAKLKAMKPGAPINVKGKNQCTFIALDECLVWYAHKEDGSYYAALCGASELTVIEQP